MIDYKTCTKCKYDRPLHKFSKSKQTKDGLTCWCKDCKRSTDRKYRKKNKEALSEKAKLAYSKNKVKIAERAKVYRENNSNTIKAKKKESYKSVRVLWKKFISDNVDLKCSECGYAKSYAALDFHHLRDKSFSIATRNMCAFNDRNKKILLAEIAKCVVLCANCHRELHEKEY